MNYELIIMIYALMKNYELILTSDGSHSLFVPEIDESYHSTNGAIQESRHIFIDAGLNHCTKSGVSILEIGFGTGLNALLTFAEGQKKGLKIRYTTLEKYPVKVETAALFNYPALIDDKASISVFQQMHNCEWDKPAQLSDCFCFEKIKCDFTDFRLQSEYDLVFFDAFSPEKQPEMWSDSQFDKIYKHCRKGAILTTYCAKGIVRRSLQNAGFSVERLPGPPGKREILRATKL